MLLIRNSSNSSCFRYSQFREEYSLEQIINSPKVTESLTKLQCCPTSDGAAAAILATEDFVLRHNLQQNAVEILGMEMATDLPSTFEDKSCMKVVSNRNFICEFCFFRYFMFSFLFYHFKAGYDMTKLAADRLFSKTNRRPTDVNVIELHDCFSANELITYEALGLCPPGRAGELIDTNANTYGGKYVINPSGGLISKGHPLGATGTYDLLKKNRYCSLNLLITFYDRIGIAQCAELCWQLRGLAGKRQVPGAKLALQHNLGLGGAVVVALYQHGFPYTLRK